MFRVLFILPFILALLFSKAISLILSINYPYKLLNTNCLIQTSNKVNYKSPSYFFIFDAHYLSIVCCHFSHAVCCHTSSTGRSCYWSPDLPLHKQYKCNGFSGLPARSFVLLKHRAAKFNCSSMVTPGNLRH